MTTPFPSNLEKEVGGARECKRGHHSHAYIVLTISSSVRKLKIKTLKNSCLTKNKF